MRGTRRSRLRWWIAGQLNRLPGQCWADLASWALGYDRDYPGRQRSPWSPIREVCRRDAAGNAEGCYCGKLGNRPAAAGCTPPDQAGADR